MVSNFPFGLFCKISLPVILLKDSSSIQLPAFSDSYRILQKHTQGISVMSFFFLKNAWTLHYSSRLHCSGPGNQRHQQLVLKAIRRFTQRM